MTTRLHPEHLRSHHWDELHASVGGTVLDPANPGYDAARAAWNLEIDQRPAVVVLAENADDVATAVRAAGRAGLGVAIQATGHGVGRPCDGGVLVNTSRMRGVAVDPVARRARVEAGAVWQDVIEAAAAYGLAGLPGSSSGVGVVGSTLGGGFGWLGRRFGLASHSVARAEIVVATGERVAASPEVNPDLFWGLLGGTGNFGIVTALEFRLHSVTQVYGGNLYYPLDRARDMLEFFARWAPGTPDELMAAVTFRRFPPAAPVPEVLRGQSIVALRGCWCGHLGVGSALVDRARQSLGPALLDTFAPMPVSALASISMDPVIPLGSIQRTEMIPDLTTEVIDAVLDLAGPDANSPLVMLELRTLGGALEGPAGALSPMAHTAARYCFNAIGATTLPGIEPGRVHQHLQKVEDRLRDHVTGEAYLNFLDFHGATPARIRAAYTAADWERLVQLKARIDPTNLFRFNRPIPVG